MGRGITNMIIKDYSKMTTEELADWLAYDDEGKRAMGILNGINRNRAERFDTLESFSPMDALAIARSFKNSQRDEELALATLRLVNESNASQDVSGFAYLDFNYATPKAKANKLHFAFTLAEDADPKGLKSYFIANCAIPDLLAHHPSDCEDPYYAYDVLFEVKSVPMHGNPTWDGLVNALYRKMNYMNLHDADYVVFVIHEDGSATPRIVLFCISTNEFQEIDPACVEEAASSL